MTLGQVASTAIGRVYRYGQKKRVIFNFRQRFQSMNWLSKILEDEHKEQSFRTGLSMSSVQYQEKDYVEIFASPEQTHPYRKCRSNQCRRIFKNIEKFLIRQQFNLVNVKQMTEDITAC